jgi:hypothetical protein
LTTDLARKYRVDVSTDNATWVQLNGINDFNPQVNNNEQDSSAYDTNGWGSMEITLKNWSMTAKVMVRRTAGVLDQGLQLAVATQLAFGDNARLYVRWYLRDTGKEAVSGRAVVTYNRAKTGVADLDEVQIDFKGDGALSAIPDVPVTPPVPTILTANPSGVAAGGQVTITGTYFTSTVATTGVKFGGVNATSWVVVSDSVIVAVMPAGTAGSAPIIVTNATGASNSFAYTRG